MRIHSQFGRLGLAICAVYAGLVLLAYSASVKPVAVNASDTPLNTPTPTPIPSPSPSEPFIQAAYFSPTAFFQDESAPAVIQMNRALSMYNGPLVLYFSTSDGTAIGGPSCAPGIDYIQVVNQLVYFDTGQYSRAVEVPLCADGVAEPGETINLSITGQVTEPRMATLTISDQPLRFSISGRVRTAGGRGIRNAEVIQLMSVGEHRRIRTQGAFGWYTFDNLAPGRSYTINVGYAPRHTFTHYQRSVPLLVGDVYDLDFTADP